MRASLPLLLAAALCWAAACQPRKEEPNLPDEKMARIMADLSMAEAATNGLAGYPKDSLMHHYFSQTFDLHGTTLEEYERNLRLYVQDPDRMTRLVHRSEELLGAKQ
ncbi:MAG TPA: DUF4296 domain-containing protein [Saprospiraceae bacterium]|nr:DUF4296 domain-containing protein [Saprospiraceae bacterium]HND89073.1 DUF4296 domain-containing protein [Saprospiraceae bacterium]